MIKFLEFKTFKTFPSTPLSDLSVALGQLFYTYEDEIFIIV